MSSYSGAVYCHIGGGEKNRIHHQGGHDGVQELIWSICIRFLFLLLPVCMRLDREAKETKDFAVRTHKCLILLHKVKKWTKTRSIKDALSYRLSDEPWVKLDLYFVCKDTKRHNHVSGLVDFLQHTKRLREERRRIRPSILWNCSAEILFISAKRKKNVRFNSANVFFLLINLASDQDLRKRNPKKNSKLTFFGVYFVTLDWLILFVKKEVLLQTPDSGRWCRCPKQAAVA